MKQAGYPRFGFKPVGFKRNVGNLTLWDPSKLDTALWLDASDESTITESSGSVSQWDDKSGNDNHVSQSTGSNQPTTNSNTINNLNVIKFDSSNFEFMNIDGNIFVNTDYEIFAVVKKNNADRGYIFGGETGNFGKNLHFGWREDDLLRTSHYGNDLDGATGGYIVDGVTIVSTQFDLDGNKCLVQNGNEIACIATQYPLTEYLDATIGRFSSLNYLNAYVCEIVVVQNLLSISNRQKVEGYLAWKWGLEGKLPSAHPYKTSRPTV